MTYEPLDERDGHVAGIESLTVDGRRYYFGFDHSSDLVVSPLIDDAAAMAEFAAAHLAQTDGRHDAAYWSELVAGAVEESMLTGDRADTELDTGALRAGEMSYHLRYLMGAAVGWTEDLFEDEEVAAALTRLGLDPDDGWETIDRCLGLDGPDAGLVLRRYLAYLAADLPGNWRTILGPLLEEAPTVRDTDR
ncbi:hypothetical protein GCM10010399_74490 [Dactylosporangium fulvum]|uniref:Uncharacterized protein n=1 Tax=Dactylosporangium fulvum TaxID=53359 RepID=A0ABY5VPZ7_9ACTN|nr:hypothetical protein [Dactylosporangium fulvum]UWP79131.1 hypothetical protein Dfulv_28640 [Dactylosporangium fulvum]